MTRFSDKVVVVTGGSSGIGLAAARRFAEEGASVVLVARNAQALDRAAGSIPGTVQAAAVDVADLDALDRLFDGVRERHGRVDVLFANAGVAALAPAAQTAPEVFDRVMAVNFRGAYYTAQKALPLMPDGGAIVFTSSWFTEAGAAGASVVSASKAAVRNLVRSLAAELAGRNIRVNAVRPGVIETALFDKLGLSKEGSEELAASLLGTIPMQRFGRAEEVASAVTFLASEEASYITGIDLPVDGGQTQL
jgi:NAD(P)-dependent dehydrogenase (short-subunit alcohol dehydrogenase family)